MTTELKHKLKIPDGWRQESLAERDHLLLTAPSKCMVTLDFNKRGFRPGLSTYGRLQNHQSGSFIGRNWKQKLADAAVAWLIEVTK